MSAAWQNLWIDMRYIVDNDLHIHTLLSLCSDDPEQTPERILQYAKENGLKTICIADHFWDERVEGENGWYRPQNFEHICKSLPLPKADGIRFLFGAETELKYDLTLGISRESMEKLDFIIIPTTHLHMKNFTITESEGATTKGRANAWVRRLEAVLNMDLPFHKIGIPHLTTLLNSEERTAEKTAEILNLISDTDLVRLFTLAAKLGVGIEINGGTFALAGEYLDDFLRIYRIAKDCGCKFYFASDAHHPDNLDTRKELNEKAVDLLGLTEDDKFII